MEKRVFRKIIAISFVTTMLAGTGAITTSALSLTDISVNDAEIFVLETGQCGENVSYTLDSNGTLVISGYGAMYDYPCEPEDVLIPDAFNDSEDWIFDTQNEDPPIIYEDDKVLYYYDNPFYDNGNIKKVIIEDGVTYIGTGAFRCCKNMESITISDDVVEIGSEAFVGCQSLTSIKLPEKLETIAQYTFWQCSGLTEIDLPNTVTSIGTGAFDECSSLSEMTVPDGVSWIGYNAFALCTSLKKIVIPNSVTYIDFMAFFGCDDLTIYGKDDSYAKIYAEENNIPFVSDSKALENNSEIAADEIFIGQTVTVTAKADGGKGNYTYAVLYKKKTDTKWVVKQNYTENDTVSVKPAKATDYDICVKVKDENGDIVKKFFTVKVNELPAVDPLENNSFVDFETLGVKRVLTITGSANGGAGDYTYAYFYKKSYETKWSTKKNFSETTSVQIAPQTITDYDICVKVKDSRGTITKKYITVKVQPGLSLYGEVSPGSIIKGQQINITGSATGGSGNYTYAYLYKRDNGSWNVLKNFSTASSASLKPAYTGTYSICVKAKDSYGTVVKQIIDVPVTQIEFNAYLDEETLQIGDTATVNAEVKGSNDSYTYAYFVQEKGATAWKFIKNFSETQSVEFKPEAVGEYTICVKAKNVSSGQVEKTYLSLNVVQEINNAKGITSRIIDDSMTQVEKVKAIHDWLVNNVEYDMENLMNGTLPDEDYTAEGLFKNRKAVCDGYSKAFMQMAQYAGFDVIIVTGVGYNSTGSAETHAWNQIKVDGNWYNIDVTWDDPVFTSETSFDNLVYDYFLVPDSKFNRDHQADQGQTRYRCTAPQPLENITGDVLENELASHEDWFYCETTDEVKAVAADILAKGKTQFTVIYKTDNMDMNGVFYASADAATESRKVSSTSCEYMVWKIEGYEQMTIFFTLR